MLVRVCLWNAWSTICSVFELVLYNKMIENVAIQSRKLHCIFICDLENDEWAIQLECSFEGQLMRNFIIRLLYWIESLRKAVSSLLSIKYFKDSLYFSVAIAWYFKTFQTAALRSHIQFSFSLACSAAVVPIFIAIIDRKWSSLLNWSLNGEMPVWELMCTEKANNVHCRYKFPRSTVSPSFCEIYLRLYTSLWFNYFTFSFNCKWPEDIGFWIIS